VSETRTIDLFAGCGGMSLGFQLEKFSIIEAHDNWQPAIDCYQKNFNHPILKSDLSEYQSILPRLNEYSPDLIIGGPPCQEFSHAGTRVEGDRADLTTTFSLIVSSVKPNYFVMENVERCAKSNAYQLSRNIFKSADYGVTEIVLNAARCGVPQRRKRFFSIGILGEKDGFLVKRIEENLSTQEMTLRDYFKESLGLEHYYRHPRNYNRRGIYSIDEPSPTVRGVNRPVPDGYKGHPGDPVSKRKNLRPLTTRERSMIQTFPPDFVLPSTKTATEQLIGNAVPVNMARFVARCLREHNRTQ
jgi:DNA (cytosine-5)-methyltransferase 1